ncbi:amino acid adenylation domain-containing protein [Nocardia jiangsuensis]|uniref:Amino acid adenylation domain-containing protein n=1 Tax=Nocardia jiangsuensis TaxID=1691563 RepID=A0ABV8DX08_9NOCA
MARRRRVDESPHGPGAPMTRPTRTRPTRTRGPRTVTLPQLLATAVEANPEGAALVFAAAEASGAPVGYAELDARSSRLARLLIERGIGPEDLVAVGLRRSVESVLAVWAVAKTGAGFVPVDPNYPADRVRHMLTDSGAALGLTVASARAALPDDTEWLVLDDPATLAELENRPPDAVTQADRVRPVRAEHPAYVIYTSGSTGLPKGVVVTQAGLAGFCAEQRERYGVDAAARTLHFASPSFDASVLELLLALGGGATMVVVSPEVFGGTELADVLRRERVTHAFVTPAALASVDPAGLDALRVVVTGGEACPPDLVRRWVTPLPDGTRRRFHNAYGPTEATVATNISAPMLPGEPVTIGAPIRGIAAHVLDARLLPVPDRVAGELYVAGQALARGYHGKPGLTAGRFVADPLGAPGSRLYRTGDVVRGAADGELEYLGRNDFQVKIRGFRIELGEIDAVLTEQRGVDFAATVGHELDSGATVLVSYVHGDAVDTAVLASAAGQRLPAHMVPAAIVLLDAIPLTPGGKLDRKALPAPVFAAREFRAPSGRLEELVAGVYAELLRATEIGADDDFFELGGNSLIATQVIARLNDALETRIPVPTLFEAPTVAGLALRLVEFTENPVRLALTGGPRPDRIPLSPAQRRMWFLNRFDPESTAYNIPIAVRFRGDLDVTALRAAVADLAARHEVLRTLYPQTEDGPVQVVLPVAQSVPEVEYRTVAPERLPDAVAEVIGTLFDVTAEVPVRVALLAVRRADGLPPEEHALAMVVHHITADGSSVGPLTRDLMTAYVARAGGTAPDWAPLPVQYADYSLWQQELLGSERDPDSVAARQIAFWQDELAGLPDQLELPADRPRPAVQSYAGGMVEVRIDAETHRALGELARANGATLFMVVHTALAVWAGRLSGANDVAIGTPIAGRDELALEQLIGMFVNTLVFRTRLELGAPFSDLLKRQRDTDIQVFAHADVPFERLVEVLNPERSTARHPLFQLGLSFQNLAPTTLELPGLAVSAVDFETAISQFDLHWMIGDAYDSDGAPAGIGGVVTYATALFDEFTVRGFVDRFLRVLRAVAQAPETPVGDLPLLQQHERDRLLLARNATAHPVDPAATLVSLFDATVAEHPAGTALIGPAGSTLDYAALGARVNRLARHLISLGVGPEARVALALPRSVELVVAMYAVAVAGGAYVPLDPAQPAQRTGHILSTAAPICVLTDLATGFSTPDAPVLVLDDLRLDGYDDGQVRDAERLAPLHPANTAYVIFTSGSTGRPKGVAVPHGAIVNQLLWKRAEFRLGAEDAVLLKTAATFDLSVWEFWSAVVCGGSLVIADADGHRDPGYLNELMAREKVTTLHAVPSMLDALLTEADGSLPASLLRVLAIGEALPAAVAQRFRRANPAELFNLYGPTEAAVSITAHRVTGADQHTVSIGDPEWNCQVYVLDPRLNPVPMGVAGELYLAGAQLARGYFGRPELTADRFVANPFRAGDRMYRTGDLAAWNPLGELEYRGRTDFQVKVRGFRIELGEIEAALLEQPDVAQVAVLARPGPDGTGERLVAYLAGKAPDVERVRTALAARLPSYMVPAAFVLLDALPLTVNGKLDRAALPEPQAEQAVFRAPEGHAELVLAEVFTELLGVERVGADDDFFALGGDSIASIQVVARARTRGVTISPREVFEHRTVAALAAAATAEPPDDGLLPLTPDGLRLLADAPAGIELRAIELDVPVGTATDRVWAAADGVLARHPMLSARLVRTEEGEPAFELVPPAGRAEAYWLLDAAEVEPGEYDQVVEAVAAQLDPAAGANVRFVLITPAQPDQGGTLLVVANGLVIDDAAWRIVVDELSAVWSGGHAAPAVTGTGASGLVRALAARAADPATLAELEWWRAAVPRGGRLYPGDLRIRGRLSARITREAAGAVATVADAYHATVDEVLLTALALALADPTAPEQIGTVVRLTADARTGDPADFSGSGTAAADFVAAFTTTYPLALRLTGIDFAEVLDGGPAAGVALGRVKEMCRAVPAGGVGFGLLRHANPATAGEIARLDRGLLGLRYRDLRPARVRVDSPVDDLVLDLTVDATPDGLVARFDYAAAVLDLPDVQTFAERWVRALGGLAEHGRHPEAGGHTPSDFPLVPLAQRDVDQLTKGYPELADVWPVTPLQSGMLFHALLAAGSVDAYTMQFGLHLTGPVDATRLRAAAELVLIRYPNLRVAFAEDGAGDPVQVVLDAVRLPWRFVDLGHLADGPANAARARVVANDLATPFDMHEAPMLRFTLIRTAAERHQLLVTAHHILVDGWSMPLLLRDLLTVYALVGRVRRPLGEPIGSYRDYLLWLAAQDRGAARTAWRAALSGIDEPTALVPALPESGPGAAGIGAAGIGEAGIGEAGFTLSVARSEGLSRLAAELGVTVNTVVQAAWGLLIGRSTDRDDVVFGATVSGRPPQLPGVETLVGLFVNTVPVRVRLEPGATLAALLRTLQLEQAALLDHHHVGLAEIQELTGVDPLFDTLVVFESFPIDKAALERAGLEQPGGIDGMHLAGVDVVNNTHYPITVMVVPGRQLQVTLKHRRDAVNDAAAALLAERFAAVIDRFVRDRNARVAEVELLTDAERAALAAANDTEVPEFRDEATLLTLFDAQVARTPDTPAVMYEDTRLSYSELDLLARALAQVLTERGVGPGSLVGIAMRRSLELVASIYAVLRTGAAYVPIDPDHPAERSEYVLTSAAPICVLTTARDGFTTDSDVEVVELDSLWLPDPDSLQAEPPASPALPDSAAYVIYTSGSTGRPKGVVITHRQMVNQFRWAQWTYPHGAGDLVLHKTPITFDISTWELFWPLQTGATVLIAEPDGHRDPAYLLRELTERRVTAVHFVPSMLAAFLDELAELPRVELPALRWVFAAGEALTAELATRFAELLPQAYLVNWYGPAEATVVTAYAVSGRAQRGGIPIGAPVANTEALVLDRQLAPVPFGAAGELYLAGVQLARGYANAPGLTAERFVAHGGGQRLYRTGDVVRWRPDGDGAPVLEYLGRSDFQVKLRGQRIELGEIESVLLGHPAVRQAVVTLVRGENGDRLVGYLVPEPGAGEARRAVLAHARAALPAYMVPSALVLLDAMPLNASGKLDRRALPAPELSNRPYRAALSPLEQTVAGLFAEVLELPRAGMDDDFFELGGNSLLATRLVARLRAVTGVDVRVQWLFTDATVAAVTTRVRAVSAGQDEPEHDSDAALGVLLPLRRTGRREPLFCLHPMYGLAWSYAGLAAHIDQDRPILGIQSPALTEDGYLAGSLPEIAERYLAEIRAVQPHGPYHLLGWSLGGIVAHAIATTLQAAGEEVALLAMLDSHHQIDISDFRSALRAALGELGIDDAVLGALPDDPDHDLTELPDEALALLHAAVPAEAAVLTPERVRRIYRNAVRSAELINRYRPEVFRGALQYFSAAVDPRPGAAAAWRPYVDGEVVDRPVDATHDLMAEPRALAEIGPQLNRLLDRR